MGWLGFAWVVLIIAAFFTNVIDIWTALFLVILPILLIIGFLLIAILFAFIFAIVEDLT